MIPKESLAKGYGERRVRYLRPRSTHRQSQSGEVAEGIRLVTQGTDPSVSDARHYPILQIQPQNGKTILNFVPKRGFIILYHLE